MVYTPNAADGGTLDLTSLSSTVTINTIETLTYDGQNDNDTLTVVGTAGNDVIVHNPGANNQAGSFSVNSLLPLSYQNLGSGGSLTANGGAGGTNDTLVYNGTASNDSFTIGAAGQVNLNCPAGGQHGRDRDPDAAGLCRRRHLHAGAGDLGDRLHRPSISMAAIRLLRPAIASS